jgi:hypothetical protein
VKSPSSSSYLSALPAPPSVARLRGPGSASTWPWHSSSLVANSAGHLSSLRRVSACAPSTQSMCASFIVEPYPYPRLSRWAVGVYPYARPHPCDAICQIVCATAPKHKSRCMHPHSCSSSASSGFRRHPSTHVYPRLLSSTPLHVHAFASFARVRCCRSHVRSVCVTVHSRCFTCVARAIHAH